MRAIQHVPAPRWVSQGVRFTASSILTLWMGAASPLCHPVCAQEPKPNPASLPAELTWEAISNRWGTVSAADLRQAAEGGEPAAQLFLGWTCAGRNSVTKDLKEAPRSSRRQSALTSPSADYACQAARWYRTAADQGLREAQFEAGFMHERGNLLEKNLAEAARYYRLAADKGHAMAQNNLGHLYLQGAGVSKDLNEAAKWYRKSAEQGEAYGQSNLAWMYETGTGVPKNKDEARAWYRKAAEQGFAQAQFRLGHMSEFDGLSGSTIVGNYEIAAEWYEKAAQKGHLEATLRLGDLFYYGHLRRDHQEAAKWFRQAAEKGNRVALMRLGELYSDNHEDLASDHAEAAKWFRRAAENGDAEAQYKLACLLLEGQGIPHDPAEAKSWLQKSAELGNPKARLKLALLNPDSAPNQLAALNRDELEAASYHAGGETRLTLATAYEEGRGGPVDFPKAAEGYWRIMNLGPDKDRSPALTRLIDLYAQGKLQFAVKPVYGPRNAEELGRRLPNALKTLTSAHALFQVGDLYYQGELVPRNLPKAVEYLKQAARDGNAAAINRLGELWAAGVDGTPDPEEAAHWYRRAATKGCVAGQLNLARALQTGTGVAPDPVAAWAWLRLAADQKVGEAQSALHELETKLTPEQLASAKRKAQQNAQTVGDQPASRP